MKFNFSAVQKFFSKVSPKKQLAIKSAFLIAVFILVGNVIFSATGVTNQISKIFFWEDSGTVAGESTVRIAATCTTSCQTPIGSYYEKWLMDNYDKPTTFEQRKAAFLQDNGAYFFDKYKSMTKADRANASGEVKVVFCQALWPALENNSAEAIKLEYLGYCLDIFEDATNAGIAYTFRALKHPNMPEAGKAAIRAKYDSWLSRVPNGVGDSCNKNGCIQQAAGTYLYFQEYAATKDPTGSKRKYLLDNTIFNYYDDYVNEAFRNNEFDMGNYTWTFVGASALLYDFATDPVVKARSKMALDFLLLDMGMDFSANQPGGGPGMRVYASYVGNKGGIIDQKCILLGLGCAFPEEYAPYYDTYLTTYRPPDVLLDAVDISEEPDNYWHEHFEYNNDIDSRGKVTYITKYYNLGGGYRWNWIFNAKSDQYDACDGKYVGFPFRLVTLDYPPYENFSGYTTAFGSSNGSGRYLLGGSHYQYKNYLVTELSKQQYLHLFVKMPCGVSDSFNARFNSWDTHEEEVAGTIKRYYLKEGKAMVAVEINNTKAVIEAAIEGLDYPNLAAFKKAFLERGQDMTSKGEKVTVNTQGEVMVNSKAYYPSGNFPRMETKDNNGNYVIKWTKGQQTMAVSRHGKTCTYNFKNWSTGGDCGATSAPAGDTSAPVVNAFSLATRTDGAPATFSWSTSDNENLAQVELWRTNNTGGQCNQSSWAQVGGQIKVVSGTSASGTFSDTPDNGDWCYGIHVKDAAGNLGYEPATVKLTMNVPTTKATAPAEMSNYVGADYKTTTVLEVATSDGTAKAILTAGVEASAADGIPLRQLTINKMNTPGAAKAGEKIIKAYSFGEDGAVFSSPIKLVFKYSAAEMSGIKEDSLYIGYWSNNSWVKQTGVLDKVNKTVTLNTDHFSDYALIGSVQNLQIATGAMLGGTYDARSFYVSDDGVTWEKTYAAASYKTNAQGKLMNLRAANAIFDDENTITRPAGFNADTNTTNFINSLPAYNASGIWAITVGLQGGYPGYENAVASAFNPDGSLKAAWMSRLDRVIRAARDNGMIVIVSCFYQRQTNRLDGDPEREEAVVNLTDWLKNNGFKNVIIEIANEYTHSGFSGTVIANNINSLISLAKGRMDATYRVPVTASGGGDGTWDSTLTQADIIMVHGNELNATDDGARVTSLFGGANKPVVMNEDDGPLTGGTTFKKDILTAANSYWFTNSTDASAFLQEDKSSATNVFNAGGSWGLHWWPYNQYTPFSWTPGTTADASSKANYFKSLLDHVKSLVSNATQTCAQAGGTICTASQNCSTGTFTSVTDSQRCCVGTCSAAGSNSCNNDGTCDGDEDSASCPNDCKVAPTPKDPANYIKADINCDNVIDTKDLGIMMSCWGNNYDPASPKACAIMGGTCQKPDINGTACAGDGKVDISDWAVLLSCWKDSKNPNCCSNTTPVTPSPDDPSYGCKPYIWSPPDTKGIDAIDKTLKASWPELALDPTTGNVVLTYAYDVNKDCLKGLFFRKYNINSKTWSDPILIPGTADNGGLNINGGWEGRYRPHMNVDAGGVIHVIWTTTENPAVWYSYSSDGGATWNGPQKVANCSLHGGGTRIVCIQNTDVAIQGSNVWTGGREKIENLENYFKVYKKNSPEWKEITGGWKDDSSNLPMHYWTTMAGSNNRVEMAFVHGTFAGTVSCSSISCGALETVQGPANVYKYDFFEDHPHLTIDNVGTSYLALSAEKFGILVYKKTGMQWNLYGTTKVTSLGGLTTDESLGTQFAEDIAVDRNKYIYIAGTFYGDRNEKSNYDGLLGGGYQYENNVAYAIITKDNENAKLTPVGQPYTGMPTITSMGNGAMMVWFDFKDGYLHYKIIPPPVVH